MNRYILFAGSFYYPNGGTNDMRGNYRTIEEAIKAYNELQSVDWGHILDTTTGEIIPAGAKYSGSPTTVVEQYYAFIREHLGT